MFMWKPSEFGILPSTFATQYKVFVGCWVFGLGLSWHCGIMSFMGVAFRACVGVANEAKPVLECSVWPWPLCLILLISFVKWFSFTFFQENISENTDNIANLPERKAIIRLEKEAKRLEEAKRLCLDQNDPRYKKLWICLVFFKL